MQLSATETARRLRAMWGYSMLEQETFIAELGIDREAARRMLRRSTPAKAANGVLERAAEISGFPKSLALDGLDAEHPTVAERVEALERKVETLTRRESDEPRTPPGELGRNAQGSPPTDGRPKQDDSPDEEEDSQSGTGEA